MKNKRRCIINDKKYQVRIVLSIVFICCFFLIMNLILFNVLSYDKLETLRWKMHLSEETTGDIVREALLLSTSISLILTIGTLIIFIWHMFRKTSGPIYGLKSFFERAEGGNLSTDIYLRKGDDFKETAASCNIMISSIRERFSDARDKFDFIEKEMNSLKDFSGEPEMIREKCRMLMDTLDSVRKSL